MSSWKKLFSRKKKVNIETDKKKPTTLQFLYDLQLFKGGQRGTPIKMFIFRKDEWSGPEPVGELVFKIAQSLQSQFGVTVPEADYHTCQPMEVMDNPEDLNSFLGGPTHATHFMLMRFADELLKGAMEAGTHNVLWVAFEDSKGSRGMIYIFTRL